MNTTKEKTISFSERAHAVEFIVESMDKAGMKELMAFVEAVEEGATKAQTVNPVFDLGTNAQSKKKGRVVVKEHGMSREEQRFQAALKIVDFTDAFNKEVSNSTAKHRPEMINFGKFYRDSRAHGFRKAVLNVADDLAL